MGLCFCTGKCREFGYCPNSVPYVAPYYVPQPVPPSRPPTVTPFPAPSGWICPSCGAGVAPWQAVCPKCSPPITITFSTT